MKIISYNVNGIRAAVRKGFIQWLVAANPDVICLQEIKANKEQLDVTLFEEAGYPYHYWFSAEKKGYSGVAILSKTKPNQVTYGANFDLASSEGRIIQADFESVSVVSLYLPSGTNDLRLDLKFQFMDDFFRHIDNLKAEKPNLVVCGDYNICHQEIDIHNPKGLKNVSGFLPEERQWMSDFIQNDFIDSFRELNPNKIQYSWWSYRANARNNNKGWRLDYLMATKSLKNRLDRAYILPEAKHSDHCPVVLELKEE
ncbi:MAG TPA: exodeoxyribonuclease III [Flavobacteriia bacterium]|jgi:exodeoxyribonuclease-3|nr:exodeoxyribonuclease III [Flavobacteriia bacterium]